MYNLRCYKFITVSVMSMIRVVYNGYMYIFTPPALAYGSAVSWLQRSAGGREREGGREGGEHSGSGREALSQTDYLYLDTG